MDHKGCQVSDAVDTKSFELAEDVWLIKLCLRLGRERVVRALKQVEEGFIHDRSHLQTRERGTQHSQRCTQHSLARSQRDVALDIPLQAHRIDAKDGGGREAAKDRKGEEAAEDA